MARIGFIGLGNMGRGMAANLARKGESLIVHDVVEAPVRALVELGARAASSAAELSAESDVIFTMLPTTAAVADVVGGASGLLAHARKGTVVVDMSTIDPLVTDRLAADAAARGIGFADAPASSRRCEPISSVRSGAGRRLSGG